jgi:pSer/pThr/pTyr-binding forkhead associated (FHA) protein
MKLIKIGRSKECDVVFENDTNISRIHAEIFQDDDENIFLTDLNSSNGTFVNGKRINESVIINKSDIVKLGKTVIPWNNYIIKEKLPVSKTKVETIEKQEKNLGNKRDLNQNISNNNIYYLLGVIVLAGIFVNINYGVKDISIIAEILGVLFIPTTIAFVISLYSKIKFEIALTFSTVLILASQILIN